MILKNDFFTTRQFTEEDNTLKYQIQLNPTHEIYKAHFPGNPVTPGVCITQIVQELVTEHLQQKFFLSRIIRAKFTNVVNPLEYPDIDIDINIEEEADSAYRVTAKVYKQEVDFASISLILTPLQ